MNGNAGDFDGIYIGAANCTVKGLMITGFSFPSKSGIAISGVAATGNKVGGCYIGTEGMSDLGCDYGVKIAAGAQDNTVGGTGAGAGNAIGGNSQGIRIHGSTAPERNVVQGSSIGTDAAGANLGNTKAGVDIEGGQENTIGGTAAGAGNIIGKCEQGVRINGTNNVVQGNYIGTNGAGANLGNTSVSDTGPAVLPPGWEQSLETDSIRVDSLHHGGRGPRRLRRHGGCG